MAGAAPGACRETRLSDRSVRNLRRHQPGEKPEAVPQGEGPWGNQGFPHEASAASVLGGDHVFADLPELRLGLAEHLDDLRVELAARLDDDLVDRLLPWERRAV